MKTTRVSYTRQITGVLVGVVGLASGILGIVSFFQGGATDVNDLVSSNREVAEQLESMRKQVEQDAERTQRTLQDLAAIVTSYSDSVNQLKRRASQSRGPRGPTSYTDFQPLDERYSDLQKQSVALEVRIQKVNHERMQLANQISSLINLAEGSHKQEELEEYMASLKKLDKNLELQLRRLDTEWQAAQTELGAVSRVLHSGSFKLMG